MDLTKDGSEDGSSTPAEKETGTIPLAPTKKAACAIPPTIKEAATTPEEAIDSQQQGTPKPIRPAAPSSISCSCDNDTEDEEYLSCFVVWLGLDPVYKRLLDDKMMILAHQERIMGNKAIPIFQQAVNKDPELFIKAWAQITAAMNALHEAIVQLDTRLGNTLYFATSSAKGTADTDRGKRKRVRKERESLCFSFGFMVFPLGLRLCFSFGSTSVSFLWVYVILMFFQVWVYSYAGENGCALHKGPRRSYGWKICFSPPPPFSLAED